jgi:hypothetical protein
LPDEELRAEARCTVVRRAVQRFNDEDFAGFAQIFAPDVVLLSDPQVASRREYHGLPGIQEWIEEALSRWVGVRFHALAAEPVADTVLVELAVVGDTEAGGGAWRLYVLLRWAGDLVNRVRAYPDRSAAVSDARRL